MSPLNPPKTDESGFTLVEILVVLVIVALVSTLLTQTLTQVFQLETRFGRELVKNREEAMLIDWFRLSVQGVQPDTADGAHAFKGGANSFSALTTNALGANYGPPTPITWTISENAPEGWSALEYKDTPHTSGLLTWSGEGRFSYIDAKGNMHDQWPPASMEPWPQIPAAILLRRGEEVVMATPRGPYATRPRPTDLFRTQQP